MADPRPITGSAGYTVTAVDDLVEIQLRFDEHPERNMVMRFTTEEAWGFATDIKTAATDATLAALQRGQR